MRHPRYLFLVVPILWVLVAVGWYYWSEYRDGPNCPRCGPGDHVVPIIYGYPDWMYPLADGTYTKPPRGRHAGCVIKPDSRRWHCEQCGEEWGRLKR